MNYASLRRAPIVPTAVAVLDLVDLTNGVVASVWNAVIPINSPVRGPGDINAMSGIRGYQF